MEWQIEQQFTSDLKYLPNVRRIASDLASGAPGDSATTIYHLQLILTEAFSNIVRHVGANPKILIRGKVVSGGVVIEVCHTGRDFDPTHGALPDFSGQSERGFGVYLMQMLSNQLDYFPKGEGRWNALRIFKRYWKGEHMEIRPEVKDGILIIKLEGETLDAGAIATFKTQVTECIEELQNYKVIFDLGMLQFIDSSGLGAFISTLRYVHAHHGDLKLAQMSKPVKTMFEIVRMNKLFEVFATIPEAVSSFASQPVK